MFVYLTSRDVAWRGVKRRRLEPKRVRMDISALCVYPIVTFVFPLVVCAYILCNSPYVLRLMTFQVVSHEHDQHTHTHTHTHTHSLSLSLSPFLSLPFSSSLFFSLPLSSSLFHSLPLSSSLFISLHLPSSLFISLPPCHGSCEGPIQGAKLLPRSPANPCEPRLPLRALYNIT